MAFNLANLYAYGATGKNQTVPNRFHYWNYGQDTVTTAGFVPANVGVKAGDIVEVQSKDYATLAFYYVTESSGVLTLALLTGTFAEEEAAEQPE